MSASRGKVKVPSILLTLLFIGGVFYFFPGIKDKIYGSTSSASASSAAAAAKTALESAANRATSAAGQLGTAVKIPTPAVPSGGSTADAGGESAASASTSAGEYSIIQEPAAGFVPIYDAINGAKQSIDMTMYELSDTTAQADFIAATKRGVNVRILLDQAFHGQQANQKAFGQLTAAGVQIKWASAGQIFHQKTLMIDGVRAIIGTGNLTSQYYVSSVDAWIVDNNAAQVNAIAATFANDWNGGGHSGNSVGAPGLVWSPGAANQLVAQIGSAKTSVDFSSEELADPRIIAALASAAKRGVTCRILMTDSASWDSGFTTDTAAGCTVHVYPSSTKSTIPYIHEKQIIVDGSNALLGSQNASATSLNKNRELSIDLSDPTIVKAVESSFASEYNGATSWQK